MAAFLYAGRFDSCFFHPTLAMKPLIFVQLLFHARCHMGVNVQRKFRRGMTENFRDCFRVDTALDCQRRECVSEVMESDVFLNSGFFRAASCESVRRSPDRTFHQSWVTGTYTD